MENPAAYFLWIRPDDTDREDDPELREGEE
jgi:hypothetical protein